MALEGTPLAQPKQPTGPIDPRLRWIALGILAGSAVIGMFFIGKPKLPPKPTNTEQQVPPSVAAISPDGSKTPCDFAHEAKVINTDQASYMCVVAPDGTHYWKVQTLKPEPTSPKTPAQSGGGTATTSATPGQTPEQARKDTIAEQRRDMLIKAVFSDRHSGSPEGAPAQTASASIPQPSQQPDAGSHTQQVVTPLDYDRNQPLYWLAEGSLFDGVVSKIDGSMNGPFEAEVTTKKYYPGTMILLIPQGAKLLGEVSKVSTFGQDRVAVTFHRLLVYPSIATGNVRPYSVSLDRNTPGKDQTGANGLTGKVNNHFLSTFGAALAVGGISGLSSLGSYGGSYSPSSGFFFGLSNSASTATAQVLDKYLNRPPSIVVAPGTRIKVALIGDVQFPAVPQVL